MYCQGTGFASFLPGNYQGVEFDAEGLRRGCIHSPPTTFPLTNCDMFATSFPNPNRSFRNLSRRPIEEFYDLATDLGTSGSIDTGVMAVVSRLTFSQKYELPSLKI